MNLRVVDHSDEPKPRWEIRAIKWLAHRLRDQGQFKLRLGHSLVLEQPEPELYMEVVYGGDEIVVLDMTFNPQVWPRIVDTMKELHWKLEREYEEVKGDD